MKKLLLVIAASVMLLGTSVGQALALPFQFDEANSYVDVSGTADPGLVMWWNTNSSLGDSIYNLEVGDSQNFLFGKIGTNESWINPDDTVASPITAYFEFLLPDDLDGTMSGEVNGFASFLGFEQGWTVTWDSPVTLNFGAGDTGEVRLSLQDASFAACFWQGPDGCVPICGTLEYVTAPIPEPCTMALLGAGLGLMGFGRFRKRTLA